MYHMIIVRFGEMTLKGANYKIFLKKLIKNIKRKLRDFNELSFSHTNYRFYIYLNGFDEVKVLDVLKRVSGIHSYSLCQKTSIDLDEIAQAIITSLKERKAGFSFKIETNRALKSYPLTSIQISQELAKRVIPNVPGIRVDVHNPDLKVSIDFRYEGVYIYSDIYKGLGGYPAGIAGKALVMLSGGIDSPVAQFLAIKKGVQTEAIHFASPPYTANEALQKVFDLAQKVSLYSEYDEVLVHVVNFTQIQVKIQAKAKSSYLMTIMRRAMLKIASSFAIAKGIEAIINGESIGQVASQTIESMRVNDEVSPLPVLRPLLTYDKIDIVKIAKEINTFDISILDYEDCCTVFVPKHPLIKPKLALVLAEEERCELDDLVNEAINSIITYKVSKDEKPNVLNYKNFEI